MRNLNYNHLYYFWTVAKEGSIAKAAEVLFLTPQTISGQLRVLENTFDEKLFEKSGRQLILTQVGQTLFEYTEEIFKLGNELFDIVKGNIHQQSFKVGLSDHIPKAIVYKLLEPALKLTPPVHMICHEGKLEELAANLSLHKLDLVLANNSLPPNPNLRLYNNQLGESDLTFFAAPKLISQLNGQFPAVLDSAPFLLPTADSPLRRDLELWFHQQEVKPIITGEFDDGALLTAFGQAGAGIFVSPSVIKDQIKQQYNVEELGNTQAIVDNYVAITAERKFNHPAFLAIIEAAKEDLFNHQQ